MSGHAGNQNFAFSSSVIKDGLVLYLDATSSLVSSSYGYAGDNANWYSVVGNNGTLINSPIYTIGGVASGSFGFNGSNQYVVFPNNTALDNQSFSVEVWVKTNNITQNGFFFEKGHVNTQYSLFQDISGFIIFRTISSGIENSVKIASSYLSTTVWKHVVGAYTSGNKNLYVNGVNVANDTPSGTIDTNAGGMSIGVFGGYDGGRGYYYNGNLSVCRVYNRALSLNEITSSYSGSKARFGL